jgi:hypothetical protein
MNPVLAEVLAGKDPYDELPIAVRQFYTREQYLWLSDVEKSTLILRECEPDIEL